MEWGNRKRFANYEELGDYMVDRAQDECYIVAILFYEDAIGLLSELMLYKDLSLEAADIQPPGYGDYDAEYYVSLADDRKIAVEPAYANGRYLRADADITLVDRNACPDVVGTYSRGLWYEISIDGCGDD